MIVALAVAAAAALVAVAVLAPIALRSRRETFVRTYMFPPGLLDTLATRRPELSLKDRQLVAHALRQFFLVYLKGRRRNVAMPSQAVDDLWHEFILCTRDYEAFCRRAFGRFLHHTPAIVLGPDRRGNAGLRRTWWHACLEENINPRRPTRLPLLFALDKKLGIANGFVYALDCNVLRRQSPAGDGATVHCGSDFGSTSFDGTTDGFGDGSGGGGDSGGAGASSDGGGGGDGGAGGCSGGCSS